MGFNSLDQAGYLSLLKRLQGRGGYSDDDGANVNKEWNAVAKVAELVSTVLEAAGKNMFVTQAVELLTDYERFLYMPSDERLTDAQRQSRLKAFARALPKMIEARLDSAFDAYLGATSGITVRPTSTDSLSAQASPYGGLYVQRQEPSADSQEIRTLELILARGLPARALGGRISTGNATFGSGSIDRKSINTSPAVSPPFQTKSRVAVYEFFPGSVIDRDQWIEVQSMLLWKSRGFSISQMSQGRTIVVAGQIDASATAIIDGPTHGGAGAISWHDRFVQCWGVYSDTDVRPGGAAEDLSALIDTKHCWLGTAKLGNAATAYVHELTRVNGATNIGAQLSVNAAGDLTLTNTVAATRYFVLMIRCTPTHTLTSTTDTQPWVNTIDIVNAELTQIARSVEIRDANGGGAGWSKTALFSSDQGAMRRLLYTGGLGKIVQTGSKNSVVLDSSEDWRKRYVLVVAITKTASDQYPSANADGMTARMGQSSFHVPRLFFTGPGSSGGSATIQPYEHADRPPGNSPDIWIYADSTTGELKAEMKATDSTSNCAAGMFLVLASEQYDGGGTVTAVPLHATQIHALDLNQPQNNGCIAQGVQGGAPRAAASSTAPGTAPTTPPLGLVAEGGSLPRRPLSFAVRERVGRVDDSTWTYRQKLVGQRKRIISIEVPANSTVALDLFNDPTKLAPGTEDQMDFRDRFVWFEGRYSATNITVSANPQNSDVTVSRFCGTLYTGPFGDQTLTEGDLTFKFEFSRKGTNKGIHSRLVVTETGGSTKYLNVAIEASGFLGLTDRRLYGASP